MFGMITGVVVYADPSKEPETVLLGGGDTDRVSEIQQYVGGTFDAVRRGCSDTSGANKPFMLIGYVHDEGRILNMPMNSVASVLFDQHIFGDVLLVNGTNPETDEYDGETYGLPIAFADYIIRGMYPEIVDSMMFSKMLATAVGQAVKDGTITQEEFTRLNDFMSEKAAGEVPAARFEDLPEDILDIFAKCINGIIKGGGK